MDVVTGLLSSAAGDLERTSDPDAGQGRQPGPSGAPGPPPLTRLPLWSRGRFRIQDNPAHPQGTSETLTLSPARGDSLRQGLGAHAPSTSLPPSQRTQRKRGRPCEAPPGHLARGHRGPRRAHLQFLKNLVGRPAFPLSHGDIRLLLQLRAVGGAALSFDF